MAAANPAPMKVMIAGAPAAGKGTQSQMIVERVSWFCVFEGPFLECSMDWNMSVLETFFVLKSQLEQMQELERKST